MLEIFVAIAPIFLLIVLGHILRRGDIPSLEFWSLNDRLVYWVLLPSLLFQKTSTNEVSPDLIGSYAVVILGSFALVFVCALLVLRVMTIPPAAGTSFLQGAVRHNMFIALAVAGSLYGPPGLALATLIPALLIPVTNVAVVIAMVSMLHDGEEKGLARHILRDLVRNPLIIAIGLGVLTNMLTDGPIPVLNEATSLLGNASLPVMLLCVGANIRVRGLETAVVPMLISCVIKLIIFPAAILVLAVVMGLSEMETVVALLFGVVPTSASSYTFAKQMGGDAPLMAAIVTLQTVFAFLTMPLTLTLARQFM